jgi:hypothetical protein
VLHVTFLPLTAILHTRESNSGTSAAAIRQLRYVGEIEG